MSAALDVLAFILIEHAADLLLKNLSSEPFALGAAWFFHVAFSGSQLRNVILSSKLPVKTSKVADASCYFYMTFSILTAPSSYNRKCQVLKIRGFFKFPVFQVNKLREKQAKPRI